MLVLGVMLALAPAASARRVVTSAPVSTAVLGSYDHRPVAWRLRPGGQPTWPSTEVPAWALGRGRYLLSTAWTYRCDAGVPLTLTLACNDRALTALVSTPEINDFSALKIRRVGPGGVVQDYRRNYYAVFSEQTIAGHTLAIEHGEDKNEAVDGQLYQGTVFADSAACAFDDGGGVLENNCAEGSTCVASATPSPWCSYAAFVDGTFDGRTLGPIAWPHDGYTLPDGRAASNGDRHPFSVLARSGDVYVYYLDCSPSSFGIHVARSADGTDWTTWDPRSHRWLASLPLGVNLHTYQNYYGVNGPQAAPVLNEPAGFEAVAFQAARDTAGGYIGIETGVIAGRSRLLLRTSPDLLRWSKPITIPAATGYGLLLNAQTSSNSTINPTGFYIETTNDGELALQHARLTT